MKWYTKTGIVVGSIALMGLVLDISLGTYSPSYSAIVLDKNYTEAHTDTYLSTDSKGNSSIQTIYYPAMYTVEVAFNGREKYVSVSSGKFNEISINDNVHVKFIIGKWTHLLYFGNVTKDTTNSW